MKAAASRLALLCVCTVFGKPQQPEKTRRGREKNHESAWDQAEQNKDASKTCWQRISFLSITTDPSARSRHFWQM